MVFDRSGVGSVGDSDFCVELFCYVSKGRQDFAAEDGACLCGGYCTVYIFDSFQLALLSGNI